MSETAAKRMNQRRQIYIRDSFQKRFVLQFCGIVLAGCALFGAALYGYSSRTLTTAFTQSRLHVMSTSDFLLPALGFAALIVAGLAAAVAAARVMVLSHKIAGPLYRLEKVAQAVGQGDLSFRVKLRDGDELQALAETLDKAVADLRRQVQQIEASSGKLREVIREMKETPSIPRKLAQDLEDAQAKMDEALGRFRL